MDGLQASEADRRAALAAEQSARMEEEARAAWEEVIAHKHVHRDALQSAEAESRAAVAEIRQQQAAQMQAARHNLSSTQVWLDLLIITAVLLEE